MLVWCVTWGLLGSVLILQVVSMVKNPWAAAVKAEEAVQQAVTQAVADCGLHPSYAEHRADLLHSGKLDEVLHRASGLLGDPIRTTDQLVKLLAAKFR